MEERAGPFRHTDALPPPDAQGSLERAEAVVYSWHVAVTILRIGEGRWARAIGKRWLALVVPVAGLLCCGGCRSRADDDSGTTKVDDPVTAEPVPAEQLEPPPLSPPADALSVPGGGHWKQLRAGTGAGPRPDQLVTAEVSVWGTDGKLAESSRTIRGPASFQMRMLPETLHTVLGRLGPGSSAILWLPRHQVAGFKPPSWPQGAVVIELEVLAVEDDPEPVIERFEAAGTLPNRAAQRAVDVGSIPSGAKKTSSGLRYVVQREGSGPRPASARARLATYVNAYALRLEAERILEQQRMVFTPEEAPGGLGEALMALRTGGLLQVWVPADKAGDILPGRDGVELVLDVYLHAVE